MCELSPGFLLQNIFSTVIMGNWGQGRLYKAEYIYSSLKVVGFVRSGVGLVRMCDLFLVTCDMWGVQGSKLT